MLNVKLETGDIILYHGHNWDNYALMLRYWTWWNHSALVYSDTHTAEMNTKGVVSYALTETLQKDIIVVRFKLTDEQKFKLQVAVNNHPNLKFDKWGLYLPIFERPNKGYYWCNTYVEFLYHEALGWDLNILKLMRGHVYTEYQQETVYDYRIIK